MMKNYKLLAMVALFISQVSISFAATDITGIITAKRGDRLKVEFQPHETAEPKIGDEVEFSTTLTGVGEVNAGNGKVIEVGEDFIWVQHRDDQDRPDLNMKAIIHTTCTPGATSTSKQDDSANENGKDEPGNKTTPEIIDTGSQRTENQMSPNEVHPCDEMAGDPYDDQRIGPAVEHLKISTSAAIRACQEALLKYPDNARFLFQLGRSYVADKQYQTAYSYFKKAADKGHITAQNYIGDLFSQGWGVTKDMTEAYRWYQKAAERGHVLAQWHLGEMYWDGVVVPQDLTEAVKWIRKSAEQGWIAAQSAMGRAYASGSGVTKNLVKAEKWYRKSVSENQYGWTTFELGMFLFNKDDEDKSKSEAAIWIRKAAEKGHKKAQNQLGYMYNHGVGVPLDDAQALKWTRMSAEKGHAHAQDSLARKYTRGDGVNRDYREAFKWFKKAAEQNYARSQSALGDMYRNGKGVKKDDSVAMEWYRKAADQGHANGQLNLGIMYYLGHGVPKNAAEAAKWYRKAADQNDAYGQYLLATLYEQGQGVRKNMEEAVSRYKKAAAQGDQEAKKRLAELGY